MPAGSHPSTARAAPLASPQRGSPAVALPELEYDVDTVSDLEAMPLQAGRRTNLVLNQHEVHDRRAGMNVVLLSGGVGGAKLAAGLHDVLAPGELTIIGNVGDDLEVLGLHVSPDLDSSSTASPG